jgi:hypothetical protein
LICVGIPIRAFNKLSVASEIIELSLAAEKSTWPKVTRSNRGELGRRYLHPHDLLLLGWITLSFGSSMPGLAPVTQNKVKDAQFLN